tara:strand:+ start:24017 stop:25432 length:1416 start_codon:yes stop_codon:yes gene_type:complete
MMFVLVIAFVIQALSLGRVHALEINVPEIESRVSDQFILESISKLDDFIEDIRAKESLRGYENVGFATATFVQLGTVTGIMLDQFLFRKKLVSGAVDQVKKVSTAGKAGKLPLELSAMTRRWFVGSSAINIAAAGKEKTFSVHVDDLAIFREILSTIRQKQAGLLYRVWRNAATNDPRYREKLVNMETLVRESRPSYKAIYEPCSMDPNGYKTNVAIEVYSKGLKDFFSVLLFTPSAVTKQVDAGFISPTLKSYINQEVLPMALRKCFNVSSAPSDETTSQFKQFVLRIPFLGAGVNMIEDIAGDEHHRFIARLFAVDTAARFVVFAAVFSIYRFKDAFRSATKTNPKIPEFASKFKNTWLGDTMKAVETLFAKISPNVVARVVIVSQLVVSSYSLYVIKKEYSETKEEGKKRRPTDEFNKLAKKYFHDRAIAQIQDLKKLLSTKGAEAKDRAEIEKEIRNWEMLEVEFAS